MMACQKAYNLLKNFFLNLLGPRDLSRQLDGLVRWIWVISRPASVFPSGQRDQLHRAVSSRSRRDQLL